MTDRPAEPAAEHPLNPFADEDIATVRHRLWSIFGGSVGNLIEWYDWYTYSACSIYFAPLFFPNDDPTTQLLNSAAM